MSNHRFHDSNCFLVRIQTLTSILQYKMLLTSTYYKKDKKLLIKKLPKPQLKIADKIKEMINTKSLNKMKTQEKNKTVIYSFKPAL